MKDVVKEIITAIKPIYAQESHTLRIRTNFIDNRANTRRINATLVKYSLCFFRSALFIRRIYFRNKG